MGSGPVQCEREVKTMKFAKTPPPRKRKQYKNAVTEHPAFLQLLKTMREGAEGAGLLFEPSDTRKFGVAHPWRVAVDHLRRIARDEGLPYTITKYQTQSGQRAVRAVRKGEDTLVEIPLMVAKDKGSA
jgi:hypothetical protein